MLRFVLIAIVLLTASCSREIVGEGVSIELAKERKDLISNVHYNLAFIIPESLNNPVTGTVQVQFTLSRSHDVTLDFRAIPSFLVSVSNDGGVVPITFRNGHIIIPKKFTNRGTNTITAEFIANNGSLNRSEQFLYTLLVPDRASTVFPCFDQPDIKAVFNLTLDIPRTWTAISNGKNLSKNSFSEGERFVFESTKPISTYLFAFAAGDFKEVTKTVGERTFRLYHRETDQKKLDRNIHDIFRIHSEAIDWLEEYTQIPYPFEKLDFVLIPGFQYSGMEHPGAIFYRDSRLLLDENPSIEHRLRQANLIAHEVAHQWFGNLVTMQWFNDVWLKEVFAGFMADLIVNPQFQDIDHELAFILSHFPRAFSVDRTRGANPIVQRLDNLLLAGTLYGDIIYHKSPIMMKQLVAQMGEEPFRDGVREYLSGFYMGNASWDDLIAILDKHTILDLKVWAKTWTLEVGRPIIRWNLLNDENGLIAGTSLAIEKGFVPSMMIEVATYETNIPNGTHYLIDHLPQHLLLDVPRKEDSGLLINTDGMGYGCFMPDSLAFQWISNELNRIPDARARASTQISLFELAVERLIGIDDYFNFLLESIALEEQPQVRGYLLQNLLVAWWQLLDFKQRELYVDKVERLLWERLDSNLSSNEKKNFFSCLTKVFLSNNSFDLLLKAWDEERYKGYLLNEDERTNLAFELMIRKPHLYDEIATKELGRIVNPDRAKRFQFILPAASDRIEQRMVFFENLKHPQNRKPEPWVVDAIALVHHPLRSDNSVTLIEPMLSMLPDIQRTGDIFFPKNWLDAIMAGHSSHEAKLIVEKWLNENPDLSPNLRSKVLQSSDLILRR